MSASQVSPGLLLLEDGTVFSGGAVSPGTRFGEIVFNTSMSGYQEILTDPSYRGQIVVMTQPHIGNYGISETAAESRQPWVEGFIARRFTSVASAPASEESLPGYLRHHRVPALEGIDTRAVVRRLRSAGSLRGVISTERADVERLLTEVRAHPVMAGRALVHEVTCDASYGVAASDPGGERAHLAVYDFGVKKNILRALSERGARLTVVPATTAPAEIERLGVDGVVLSNGPGDPEPLTDIVANIRGLIEAGLPIFGICLGHQLLALALGGRTHKLKFGHHGGNQPVLDRESGRVLITSQNHGFAVVGESLPRGCHTSQVNLNDGTVEALTVEGRPILSVQYHPEAAPGPHDASDLFERFLKLVSESRIRT